MAAASATAATVAGIVSAAATTAVAVNQLTQGAPKIPSADASATPPTTSSPVVQDAGAANANSAALAAGQASTILTSGQGVQGAADVAKKSLLGG